MTSVDEADCTEFPTADKRGVKEPVKQGLLHIEVACQMESIVATSTRASIILLDEETRGDVCIIPNDRDKFVLTIQEAVRACRAAEQSVRFSDQFEELLERLTKWVNTNVEFVRSAHVTIRDSDILFLVVQKKAEFDQPLVDSLTDLDLEIANDEAFNLIKLNVLSIPAVSRESMCAFLATGPNYTYAK